MNSGSRNGENGWGSGAAQRHVRTDSEGFHRQQNGEMRYYDPNMGGMRHQRGWSSNIAGQSLPSHDVHQQHDGLWPRCDGPMPHNEIQRVLNPAMEIGYQSGLSQYHQHHDFNLGLIPRARPEPCPIWQLHPSDIQQSNRHQGGNAGHHNYHNQRGNGYQQFGHSHGDTRVNGTEHDGQLFGYPDKQRFGQLGRRPDGQLGGRQHHHRAQRGEHPWAPPGLHRQMSNGNPNQARDYNGQRSPLNGNSTVDSQAAYSARLSENTRGIPALSANHGLPDHNGQDSASDYSDVGSSAYVVSEDEEENLAHLRLTLPKKNTVFLYHTYSDVFTDSQIKNVPIPAIFDHLPDSERRALGKPWLHLRLMFPNLMHVDPTAQYTKRKNYVQAVERMPRLTINEDDSLPTISYSILRFLKLYKRRRVRSYMSIFFLVKHNMPPHFNIMSFIRNEMEDVVMMKPWIADNDVELCVN